LGAPRGTGEFQGDPWWRLRGYIRGRGGDSEVYVWGFYVEKWRGNWHTTVIARESKHKGQWDEIVVNKRSKRGRGKTVVRLRDAVER